MKDSATTEQSRRALGAELAAYRDAAGYSQARLAALTSYSRSTIANVETGRQRVPREFWEHADTALRTGGVLASGHDALEAATRQERLAVARAATAARSNRAPHPVKDVGIRSVSPPARRFRPGDLIRLQSLRQHLKDIDNSHGGGVALPMAMSYLNSEIPPLLSGLTGSPADRPLIDAVALLQLDVGWMAYDAARQQQATQQYADALRLAQSSANRLLVARVLAAMSHQAIYLGQIRQAIDYAQTARAATARIATPRTTAMLAAMQACAFAAAGDAFSCRKLLGEAADAITLIRAQPEPESLDFDEGGYWGHAARACRDLGQLREAETCAQKAVGLCLTTHSRTRAQRYAIHAAVHLRMGEVEAAAAAGEQVVHEAWNLNSSHVFGEISQLARQIATFKSPAGAEFADQARELLDARGPRLPERASRRRW